MTDFTTGLTIELSRAIEAERAIERQEAGRRAELRSLLRRERKPRPRRTVIVTKPAHLAGVHKL